MFRVAQPVFLNGERHRFEAPEVEHTMTAMHLNAVHNWRRWVDLESERKSNQTVQ
jgi:hypothetical protein